MKKICNYIILVLSVCLSLTACEREELPPPTKVLIDSLVIKPAYVNADVFCRFYSNVTIQYARLYVSTEMDFADATEITLTRESSNNFRTTIWNLANGQKYYVRYEITNIYSEVMIDDVYEFTTLAFSTPSVITREATDITLNSATVAGIIETDGGHPILEQGICYSTSTNPTIEHLIVKSGSKLETYSCSLVDLQEGTTYYARAYATNKLGTAYGNEIQFTTKARTYENGYEYIDLGLSVKWASMNIGASSPEESGDYFAWGETTPKSFYSWSTYKYCNGTYDSLTKYNHNENMGVVDNKMVLELSDDAANVNWGGAWRMPSEDEYKELLNKCTWYSSSQNGKNGFLIQSKINGNCIFLPVAGTMYKESLYEFGKIGYYRSNAIISVMPESVDAIQCTLNRRVEWIPLSRAEGVPVRAVCE